MVLLKLTNLLWYSEVQEMLFPGGRRRHEYRWGGGEIVINKVKLGHALSVYVEVLHRNVTGLLLSLVSHGLSVPLFTIFFHCTLYIFTNQGKLLVHLTKWNLVHESFC